MKEGCEMEPGKQAKMDVIKALRKLAMEMMHKGGEEGESPEGVVAKVDVAKLEPVEGEESMEQEDMESPEMEMSEEGSVEEKIAKLKEELAKLESMKKA